MMRSEITLEQHSRNQSISSRPRENHRRLALILPDSSTKLRKAPNERRRPGELKAPDERKKTSSRRAFLAKASAVAAASLGAPPLATASQARDPLDIPRKKLREADFYKPHNLAG